MKSKFVKQNSVCFLGQSFLLLAFSLLAVGGCASLDTNRKKSFASLAIGVSGGALMGPSLAPKSDSKSGWMALCAAMGGVAAGIFNAVHYDGSEEVEKANQERLSLIKLLDAEKSKHAPKIVAEGNSLLGGNPAKELPGIIKPGGWRKYKLDRWVADGDNENIFFRQTEMLEVIPPVINP